MKTVSQNDSNAFLLEISDCLIVFLEMNLKFWGAYIFVKKKCNFNYKLLKQDCEMHF